MIQGRFVCTQLNGFKYRKWLNISISSIDGNLTDTSTPSQSEPGSNGNEVGTPYSQSSKIGPSPSDSLVRLNGISTSVGHLMPKRLDCFFFFIVGFSIWVFITTFDYIWSDFSKKLFFQNKIQDVLWFGVFEKVL